MDFDGARKFQRMLVQLKNNDIMELTFGDFEMTDYMHVRNFKKFLLRTRR
jgi:hypothetical protein